MNYTEVLKTAGIGGILGKITDRAGRYWSDRYLKKAMPGYHILQQAASQKDLVGHGMDQLGSKLLEPIVGSGASGVLGSALTNKVLGTRMGNKAYNYISNKPLMQKATKFVGDSRNVTPLLKSISRGRLAGNAVAKGVSGAFNLGGRVGRSATKHLVVKPLRFAFNTGRDAVQNITPAQHESAINYALGKALNLPGNRPSARNRILMAAGAR